METYCISSDWWSFSIISQKGFSGVIPEHYEVEELSGNNIFHERRIIRYRGSKLMTILSRPKSTRFLHQAMHLIEVGNRWLYDKCKLRELLMVFYPDFIFSNLSRVDICVDFCATAEQMSVIQGLADGRLYVGSKSRGRVDFEEGLQRRPFCFNFGSIESEVKWKLYNKTKEINANSEEECSKPWIRGRWRECGLFPSDGDIWRCELSFHPSRFTNDLGMSLGLLDMYAYELLGHFWMELYTRRFIVKERGHSRRANDKVVPFLKVERFAIAEVTRCRRESVARMDDSGEVVRILKRQCADYRNGECLGEELRGELLRNINHIAEVYGLQPIVKMQLGEA